MKKILCVIDSLCAGGAQRQLVELALGFKEKGYIVSFLTYHHIPFFNPIVEKAMISITCIQERNYFVRLIKMRRYIRKGGYNAVLSFLEATNFICEIAGIPFRNWKLVVGERNANPKILKSLKLKMYRWFHFFADYIVANSFKNIELVHVLNPFLSHKKCKVIYNMVDPLRWECNSNYKRRRNAKFKLVIAARHCYQKNLVGLIEALALLSKEESNKITIEWYGNNIIEPYMDESFIEALAQIKQYRLEKIISFYPANRNVLNIIKNSDAVGLFSLYEGLPNIICEAMACGKPVICSNISDMQYFLSYDINLLFNPADPQSIKRAIIYLLGLDNNQLRHIGAQNQMIARKWFNKEGIINNYLQLLTT